VGSTELSIFEDTIADPETRPYLYYISAVDTCGNESGLSPYHKPLFLQYISSDKGVSLGWEEYQVEDGQINFDSYTVYRGTDSLALSPLADNIPSYKTTYTDRDPNALKQKYYYRIAGILSTACEFVNGKKAGNENYKFAMSNYKENRIASGTSTLKDNDLIIYPNPFTRRTVIKFNNPGGLYQLIITTLTGKIILHKYNITESRYELDRGDLPPGVYLLEMKGSKIYREKIVIE